eukprot:scaffold7559_cov137-Skeletonema_menzelii.AAC.6
MEVKKCPSLSRHSAASPCHSPTSDSTSIPTYLTTPPIAHCSRYHCRTIALCNNFIVVGALEHPSPIRSG